MNSNEENAKLCQKGSCAGYVTHVRNFVKALISRERLKLETSNLARRRMAACSDEENAK